MALPYSEESFDLVYSIASIKHWPDQAQGLSELYRVLRNRGLLAIVEVDKRCSAKSAHRFVAKWRMAYVKRFLEVYFRRIIAGQSLDIYEMKRLMDGTAFSRCSIYTDKDLPVFVVEAIKNKEPTRAAPQSFPKSVNA
jgi:SAM-dependent methyltransferase